MKVFISLMPYFIAMYKKKSSKFFEVSVIDPVDGQRDTTRLNV
jgi:hypothetical protein